MKHARRPLAVDAEILSFVPADRRPYIVAQLRLSSEVTPADWELYDLAKDAREREARGGDIDLIVYELADGAKRSVEELHKAATGKHHKVNLIRRAFGAVESPYRHGRKRRLMAGRWSCAQWPRHPSNHGVNHDRKSAEKTEPRIIESNNGRFFRWQVGFSPALGGIQITRRRRYLRPRRS